MIPLSRELIEELEIPFLPLTDGGRSGFDGALAELVSPLIGRGKFAYIEAEFFGGDGTQGCITWSSDGKQSGPTVATDAINKALKFLGVSTGDSHDEFDALGLGRHRDTEGWLSEATGKIEPRDGN